MLLIGVQVAVLSSGWEGENTTAGIFSFVVNLTLISKLISVRKNDIAKLMMLNMNISS